MAVTKPGAELSNRLRKMAEDIGSEKSSKELGVAPATFARLVAGLPVHAGTLALVEASLARGDGK